MKQQFQIRIFLVLERILQFSMQSLKIGFEQVHVLFTKLVATEPNHFGKIVGDSVTPGINLLIRFAHHHSCCS